MSFARSTIDCCPSLVFSTSVWINVFGNITSDDVPILLCIDHSFQNNSVGAGSHTCSFISVHIASLRTYVCACTCFHHSIAFLGQKSEALHRMLAVDWCHLVALDGFDHNSIVQLFRIHRKIEWLTVKNDSRDIVTERFVLSHVCHLAHFVIEMNFQRSSSGRN